jgi:ribonuclease HII
LLVDGNRLPGHALPGQAVVKGDARHAAIAAASILAKVARDAQMLILDARYPDYGFARHKGYPTQAHLAALERLGPLDEHRRSFAPVARQLALL